MRTTKQRLIAGGCVFLGVAVLLGTLLALQDVIREQLHIWKLDAETGAFSAAARLAKMRSRRGARALLALRNDGDGDLAEFGITKYFLSAGQGGFLELLEEHQDGDPEVRVYLVSQWNKVLHQSCELAQGMASALERALKDPHEEVRLEALQVTILVCDTAKPAGIPYLILALGDEAPQVQLVALDCLSRLSPPASGEMREALEALREDPAPRVRAEAQRILDRILENQ